MSRSHGDVLWTELLTRDLKAALAYYADALGWTYDTMPMEEGGDYYIGMLGDTPVAGLMDMSGMPNLDGVPPHWFTYFQVDDVEAAAAATKAAGGEIRRAPFDIAGVGRIAILCDPTGAVMGMMKPEAPQQALQG